MTRVLVVDDEKLIVKGIRFSLEQDGMKVDCAYDGEEAIELAKQNEYDMILLDVMLPKHDGFEVCQTIREFSEGTRSSAWTTARMTTSQSPSISLRSKPASRLFSAETRKARAIPARSSISLLPGT